MLVTGCSSGFGLATAADLAGRGWRSFATMRNLDKRERLDKAASTPGCRLALQVLPLDVNDGESIDARWPRCWARRTTSLDAVVHNAGVSAGGAFEDVLRQ